jgi:hypothetical protein
MYVFAPKEDVDPKCLLAVMQSKVFDFLYRVANTGESRVIPQVKATKLLPLPVPEFGRTCTTLVKRVDSITGLYQVLAGAKSEAQKAVIQRQIDHTDAEIDRLVYALYGLTKDEIAIVEGAKA